MHNSIFILTITMILGICRWLDDMILRLGLKKSYLIMFAFSYIVLSGFTLTPVDDFYINPAVLLLIFSLSFAANREKQLSPISVFLLSIPIAFISVFAMLILHISSLEILCFAIALPLGITLSKKPLMCALILSIIPPLCYTFSILLELLAFMPYANIDIQSVMDSQIIAVASCLTAAYCKTALTPLFSQQLKKIKEQKYE